MKHIKLLCNFILILPKVLLETDTLNQTGSKLLTVMLKFKGKLIVRTINKDYLTLKLLKNNKILFKDN